MAKQSTVDIDGEVIESLGNGQYKVRLEGGDHIILAHLSGKMRMHYIKIIPGDRVQVAMSPYDLTKGRITYRHKN